jgi:hypothetical protein
MWDLFGWPVQGAVVLFLGTVGFALMSTAPPESEAAKCCFHVAAFLLLVKTATWLIGQQSRVLIRSFAAFLLFGLIGIAWFISVQWVQTRQSKHHKAAPHEQNDSHDSDRPTGSASAENAGRRIADLRARDIESEREHQAERQKIVDRGRVRTEFDEAKDRLAEIYALKAKRLRDQRHIAAEIKAIEAPQSQDELQRREEGEPNIVCLGEGDVFVELDRHEIFRESENYECALRAVTARFCNLPNPPNKVGNSNNVGAHIIFSDWDFPYEPQRVHYACWLNEESPYVSFPVGKLHHLIIGAFVPGTDGGYESFMTYENTLDPSARLSRLGYQKSRGFRIKVVLMVGEGGEFSQEHDFELRIQPSGSFTFEYLSEERKQRRRLQLRRIVEEGETLLTKASRNDWTDQLSQNSTEWDQKLRATLRDTFGGLYCNRFLEAPLREYPCFDERSRSRKGFLDRLYTQVSKLKETNEEDI